METSVNHSMCRCCASEGAFKDVKSTYHWMGEEEIYADMLRECFDINLNTSEDCDESGICEVCITQLRNAINFKKQVLHTEEHYKKLVQNKALFRTNIVKIEANADDDSEGNVSADDAFSGAEFDVPIKTEEEEQKPKKRAATTKTMTTRSKKAKTESGETSTKQTKKKKKKFIIINVDPGSKQIQLKKKGVIKIKGGTQGLTPNDLPPNAGRPLPPHDDGWNPGITPSRTNSEGTTLCGKIAGICYNGIGISQRLQHLWRESKICEVLKDLTGDNERY